MDTTEKIVNKVAQSGLITIDLEKFYPEGEKVLWDIREHLFKGMLLREKEFRAAMSEHDWSAYEGKHVAVFCSVDAIVPKWAYMLVAIYMEPYAENIVFGDAAALDEHLLRQAIARLDPEQYRDGRVIIKGCSDQEVPAAAYVEITRVLKPVVKSMMYGEPCSTVPLYKKRK